MSFQNVLDEAKRKIDEKERAYYQNKAASYHRVYGDIKSVDKQFKKWSGNKEMILMLRRQGLKANQIASELCAIGFKCNSDDVTNFLKRNEHEL